MNLNKEVQLLLNQFLHSNGRGNMISANLTLVEIIKTLVAAIERLEQNEPDELAKQLEPLEPDTDDHMVNVDAVVYNGPRPRGRPRKQA